MIGSPQPNEFSLYFHIPFCSRKCDYCHFYVLPDKESDKIKLLEAFEWEWNLILPNFSDKILKSIYFGGGTPSLFGPERISKILQWIRDSGFLNDSEIEITLEANPEYITRELMQAYAQAGINRVSLGIQTLDADLLQMLGRLHTPQLAEKAVWAVYEASIHNISVDLMYDLPKQDLRHWEKTLDLVCQLPINHLSLYNLTIEPHTSFYKKQKELTPLLPSEETSLGMYEMAIEKLEKAGLKQYEISAFAKDGKYSVHNTGYWMGRQFWGLGPSAFSYWNHKRFKNINHLNKYYHLLKENKLPIDYEEELDKEAQLRELLVIRLRLKEGVDVAEFENRCGPLEIETKQQMFDLLKMGFLEERNRRICLTKKGILFYDMVASELI